MSRRGFTIVELLVSLVVAAVALIGIYYYYATVQQAMREQGRISQAQLEARLGMEMISSDLQRAGYLATPNSDRDPLVCRPEGMTPLRVHPIVFRNGGTSGAIFARDGTAPALPVETAAQNVNVSPDDVILYGNYLSANEYLAETINAAAATVRLQPLLVYQDPGVADGGAALPAVLTDAEFAQLFPTSAFLRIVNRHGFAQFTRITSVSGFASRMLTVSPAPIQFSPATACGVEGFCEGCRVNVVNGVWYRIEQRSDVDDPATPENEKEVTDLVRYMVDQNRAPIPATRETVVRYAVDFQIWFRAAQPGAGGSATFDINLSPDVPDDGTVVIGGAVNPPDGSLTARPEAIRSAIVRVTVRTRIEDPKFPFQARPDRQQRLKAWKVFPGSEGAAHVRTYTTEVELPNIAFANLW
ncbi:MAG: prepilin-type N-terminal cleavage/methylation domain-containing protein [Deltaproteobacteria bacterium]|nr:prepilin-type N-terminal cleavage/methylation domain-containing protein [Deltaproteobacteria bacterium]